jgi:hypothetical protein
VLTEAVRRRPYQVVLFDEVEKAHSDVFNILLQVLDDGRLTDGQGRTVDFTNTIIILTSNLGSQYLTGPSEGQTVADVEPQVMEVVRGHFRPEFLNRLDEIILFHRLGHEHMGPIVDIQIERVQQLLADRKIRLEPTDGGARLAGPGRLRSGLRRPAAEAGGSALSPGPARRCPAQGRGPRRKRRPHRRRRRRVSQPAGSGASGSAT